MLELKKFEPREPLVLNDDNIYMFKANEESYTALCRDIQYNFSDADIDELCDKINAIGCTSFQLSKEELAKMIEEIDLHGRSENI